MVKVKVLSRNVAECTRERAGDVVRVPTSVNPVLHPFEREREYVRALNATKLDRLFAKPFIGALGGHFDGVNCIVKHPSSIPHLLSGDCSGQIKLWSLSMKSCLGTVQAHAGFVRGLAFARKRPFFLSCSDDKTVKQWDFPLTADSSSEPNNTWMSDHGFTGIDHAWHRDAFATSGGNVVEMWEESRSEPVHAWEWGSDTVHTVKFNPAEVNILASAGGDRGVTLYDIRAATPVHKVTLAMKSNAIAWNPREPFIFTVANDDTKLYTFDMRLLEKARAVHEDHISAVMDVDWCPTGRELVSGSFDRTVRIFQFDHEHSREVYHTKRMQRVFAVRYSLDAQYILSGSDDANVRIWKTEANKPIRVLSKREEDHLGYGKKLSQRFSAVPELRRIQRYRHVPKAIKNMRARLHIVRQAQLRRVENVRRHRKQDSVQLVGARQRPIVKVDDGSPVSKRTDVELALARETILRFFSASSDEYDVVFTSGATAALKIVGESFPWSAGSVFAYTEVNHTSVLGIRKFCASSGGTFRGLTPDAIERALGAEPSGGSPEYGCRDEEAPSHLFAFPGENNFDGEMYPLRWVEAANEGRLGGLWPDRRGKWYTLLDAAAFATTNRLDLSKIHPHFLFGSPTGSGVLLIRRDAGKVLRRPYFGGGTIKCVTAAEGIQLDTPAESLHETLEYGTQSFLSIVALKHGFKRLEALGIDSITRHVHCLTAHLAERLSSLKHSNGRKMVVVHGQHALKDPARQGPIVALSIMDPTGAYVGITPHQCGSMCNPGATQRLFGIGNEMIKVLSATSKTCSDDWDLYNGVPLGIIRVSIGYPTTFEDVEVRAVYVHLN
eukprot:m51a1_g378 hypothetical protein (837) ;mRNA; r:649120-652836